MCLCRPICYIKSILVASFPIQCKAAKQKRNRFINNNPLTQHITNLKYATDL